MSTTLYTRCPELGLKKMRRADKDYHKEQSQQLSLELFRQYKLLK
jgi:hypothetical protein